MYLVTSRAVRATSNLERILGIITPAVHEKDRVEIDSTTVTKTAHRDATTVASCGWSSLLRR